MKREQERRRNSHSSIGLSTVSRDIPIEIAAFNEIAVTRRPILRPRRTQERHGTRRETAQSARSISSNRLIVARDLKKIAGIPRSMYLRSSHSHATRRS